MDNAGVAMFVGDITKSHSMWQNNLFEIKFLCNHHNIILQNIVHW